MSYLASFCIPLALLAVVEGVAAEPSTVREYLAAKKKLTAQIRDIETLGAESPETQSNLRSIDQAGVKDLRKRIETLLPVVRIEPGKWLTYFQPESLEAGIGSDCIDAISYREAVAASSGLGIVGVSHAALVAPHAGGQTDLQKIFDRVIRLFICNGAAFTDYGSIGGVSTPAFDEVVVKIGLFAQDDGSFPPSDWAALARKGDARIAIEGRLAGGPVEVKSCLARHKEVPARAKGTKALDPMLVCYRAHFAGKTVRAALQAEIQKSLERIKWTDGAKR